MKPSPADKEAGIPDDPDSAPHPGRIGQWLRKLSLFSGLELLSRVLQMCAALMVVRTMEKDQYAWYSLAIGFQGMTGFVTMIGAGAALYSIGGPLIRDRSAMGGLLYEVRRWRWHLMAFSLPIVLPIFAVLLYRNGCPTWTIVLLLLLAAGMMALEIQRHLLTAPLELAMRFNLIQRIDVTTAIIRVLALALLLAVGWMSASTVLLVATLLVGWIPLLMLPKHTAELADPDSRTTAPDTRRRIQSLSLIALPGSLSYMLESQFAGFFIAFSGYTGGVADLGALTRLGLLLTLPTALLYKIIQPKLATIAEGRSLFVAWQRTLGFGLIVGIGMVGGVWILRDVILLILGPEYSNLSNEIVLYATFLAVSFFTNANASMLEARGWLKRSWMRPLIVLGSMTVAAFLLPVTTVHGAIGLMIVGSLGNLTVDTVIVILGFRGKSNV